MASVCWRTIVRVKHFRTCSFCAPRSLFGFVSLSNMFVCARKRKKTNMPRPRGRGFWAHYSPFVPIPGFVGVIRESDWVVWLVFRCDIDHTALGFFHDFAQFCEDLVFGHGFDVFVCDV